MGPAESGKIDPSKLAFDFDGVVANTMNLFLTIAEKDYGIKGYSLKNITSYTLSECLDIEPEIISEIVEKLLNGDYPHPLEPIMGAPGALRRIADVHKPILFVTARSCPGPLNKWIQKETGLAREEFEIVPTGAFDAKPPILRERGVSTFVEDRLDTCFLLDEAGIAPVLFVQPWNRKPHPFLEVGTWDQLLGVVSLNADGVG